MELKNNLTGRIGRHAATHPPTSLRISIVKTRGLHASLQRQQLYHFNAVLKTVLPFTFEINHNAKACLQLT
jgi:hypothetical protein